MAEVAQVPQLTTQMLECEVTSTTTLAPDGASIGMVQSIRLLSQTFLDGNPSH